MILRHYFPEDAGAVVSLINEAAVVDRTRRLSLSAFEGTWEAYADAGQSKIYDEAAVVTDAGDQLAGFAWWAISGAPPYGFRLQFEGWVHPLQRRQGVGTLLLQHVEDYIQQRFSKGSTVTVYARIFADIPGGEQMFQLHHYQLSRHFLIMRTRLQGRTWAVEIPEGIDLKSFRADDLELLVSTDNAIFADHWGSRQRTLAAWRQEMIENRPHDPKLWILAWSSVGDSIVGECLCHANHQGEPNDGWVSIVGVHPDYRGKGLGRALLAHGLSRLRDVGYDTGSLSVDAENTAAVNLYRSLGMDVIRKRLHFTKSFEL